MIGRAFRMRDHLYEIVGVGPRGFTRTEPGTVTDLFVPTKMEPTLLNQNSFVLRVFVRVLPGVQVKALADKLNAAYKQWENVRLIPEHPINRIVGLTASRAVVTLNP